MANLGSNLTAAVAFNRFGLGGRPDDALPASPIGWLNGQITGPDTTPSAGLPSTAAGLALYQAYNAATGNPAQVQAVGQQISQLFDGEVMAALVNAITTKAPFRERLVWFWSNHFAVMANAMSVACCAGAFVREAIRPNVTGTFQTMLLAVMQHPAMLYSLNNTQSAGPQSPAALGPNGSKLGINENLGRECLELHTVGVDAGYTQADVDAMAMLLTGWSVNATAAPFGFRFNAALHQPGSQVVMGQAFAGSQQGGLAALSFLATHPATYQHLATQLVTHFCSDTPAAADIAVVASALSASGGSLPAAHEALLGLTSAWQPYTKLRAPQDYVIAVLRGLGATGCGTPGGAADPRQTTRALAQPTWQPQFPNGFSDLAADWMGPAPAMARADWINALCTLAGGLDPGTIAASALGPLLQASTIAAINAAATAKDKLALLLFSPEFQRR